MGYVPPVRDAQAIHYGNRIIYQGTGMKPVSPIAKGEFYKVLRKRQYEGRYFERNLRQYNNRNEKHEHLENQIRKLTGKGNLFDESI
ncbi:hypothetical protein ACJ2A9_16665 [Anaerobacillus sp. MEB173]